MTKKVRRFEAGHYYWADASGTLGPEAPASAPDLVVCRRVVDNRAKFMPGADGKDAAASRGSVGNPRLTIARLAA